MKKLTVVLSLLACISTCFGAGLTVSTTNGLASGLTLDGATTNRGLISGGSFSGNGSGLTNIPVAKTFTSTSGFFTFTRNPDGTTNVSFTVTNSTFSQTSTTATNGPNGLQLPQSIIASVPIAGSNDVLVVNPTNLPAWLQVAPQGIYAASVIRMFSSNNVVPVIIGGDSMMDPNAQPGTSFGAHFVNELAARYGFCGTLCEQGKYVSSPNGGRGTSAWFFQIGNGIFTGYAGDYVVYGPGAAPTSGTNNNLSFEELGEPNFPAEVDGSDWLGNKHYGRENLTFNYLQTSLGGTNWICITNPVTGYKTNILLVDVGSNLPTNGVWKTVTLPNGNPSTPNYDQVTVYSRTGTNIYHGLSSYTLSHPGVVFYCDAGGGTWVQQRTWDTQSSLGQGTNALTMLYSNLYAPFGGRGLYLWSDKHPFHQSGETDQQNTTDLVNFLMCVPSNVVVVVVSMPQQYTDPLASDARARYWQQWAVANLNSNAHKAIYIDLFGEASDTNAYNIAGNNWDGIHHADQSGQFMGHLLIKKLGLDNYLGPAPALVSKPIGSPPVLWWPCTEGKWYPEERITGVLGNGAENGSDIVWTNDGSGLAIFQAGNSIGRDSYIHFSTPAGTTNIHSSPIRALTDLGYNKSVSFVLWYKNYTNGVGHELFQMRGTKNGSPTEMFGMSEQFFSATSQRFFTTWAGSSVSFGTFNLGNNQWHQVGYGYDASRRVIDWYLDGKIAQENANIPNAAWDQITNAAFYVFGDSGGTCGPAEFSDFKIYDRFIDASELQGMYYGNVRSSVSYVDQTVIGSIAASGQMSANTAVITNNLTVNGSIVQTSNSIPVAVTVGVSAFKFTNTTPAMLFCNIGDSTAITTSVGINGVTVFASTTDLNTQIQLKVNDFLTLTYSGGTPTLTTNK